MNEQAAYRFSGSGDEERIGQYRRVNFMALFGLLLGVASASALVSPFMWIVPLFTLFVGIGALLLSRREDMGGAVPSWLTITLALFFIAWAVSQFCFTRCVLYSEAYSIAENWLGLVVQGEDRIAHQGMMNVAMRQGSGISVDEYYKMDKEAAAELEERFSLKPSSDLLGYDADAEVELVKNVTQQFDVGMAMIQQIYRVSAPEKEPIEAKVTMTRRYNESAGRATWIVADVEPNDEPSSNILEVFSSFVTRVVHSLQS